MFGTLLQDFGKYPRMRGFIQEYVQALSLQNDGIRVVQNFVKRWLVKPGTWLIEFSGLDILGVEGQRRNLCMFNGIHETPSAQWVCLLCVAACMGWPAHVHIHVSCPTWWRFVWLPSTTAMRRKRRKCLGRKTNRTNNNNNYQKNVNVLLHRML